MSLRALAASSLFLFACGGPTAQPGNDSGATDVATDVASDVTTALDAATDADASLGAYPAGPYGNAEGDVFPPLVWEGYVDPNADAIATTKSYGTYSMDDVRKGGKAYALVHTSDFVDPGSKNAANDLEADAPTLVINGAVIVEIVIGNAGSAPTKTNLDAWVNTFSLPVTSVIDPSAQPLASFTALGRRELAFIVDLATMKIAKKYVGSLIGQPPSSVVMAEPDLHTFLGK